MATCKDCVHYELCSGRDMQLINHNSWELADNVELECMHFKDASKFIEIPFEIPFTIGETVYGFAYPRRDITVVQKETVEAITYGDFGNGEIGVMAVETDDAEYDWRKQEHRNMLFKTKEEAERALKRIEKDV